MDITRKVNRFICQQHEKLADHGLVISWFVHQPLSVQIEITTRCNLDCQLCPRKDYLSSPPADMSFDTFRTLVNRFRCLEQIHLFGLGEPLLHPDLEQFIAYCSNRNIPRIALTSNGMLLKNKAQILANSALTDLSISIDAGEDQTFQSIRPGGNLDKILSGIEHFREISIKPVQINSTLTYSNLSSLLLLPKIAKQAGVTEIRFRELKTYGTTPNNRKGQCFSDLPENERAEFLRELDETCRQTGMPYSLAIAKYDRCYLPIWATYLDLQGNITPCCSIPEKPATNLLGDRFLKSWNNKELRIWRKKTCSGDFPLECMERCYIIGNQAHCTVNTLIRRNGMPKRRY